MFIWSLDQIEMYVLLMKFSFASKLNTEIHKLVKYWLDAFKKRLDNMNCKFYPSFYRELRPAPIQQITGMIGNPSLR